MLDISSFTNKLYTQFHPKLSCPKECVVSLEYVDHWALSEPLQPSGNKEGVQLK